MPLSDNQHDGDDNEGYSHEIVQTILAAKDEGLVSDKAYHKLRTALPEKFRSNVPPMTAIKQEWGPKIKKSKLLKSQR